MSDQPNATDLQQKYRQFLDLMPLTLALAGLPPSETRLFSEEQIEALGLGLMRLEEAVTELRERYDLTPDDLNIDLGPLGMLLAD